MNWGIGFRASQYVKASLWILPFLGAIIGLLFAEIGLQLDGAGVLAAHVYSPETATAVLSAAIAAAASLTGFVITVTVLGVQMATGTFSPRYMRLWYRDPMLKLLLAELIGTLAFGFTVIRQVQPESVPDLSVSAAAAGVMIGLLLFMVFFDRFMHRMRPVAVAALMATECRAAFEEWTTEASRPDTAFVARGTTGPGGVPAFVVRATRAGTIQAVDARAVTRFARDHHCLLVFAHAVGDFVPLGAAIIEVHGQEPPPLATRRLSGMVALGVERTIEQDPSFAIRVMVDVATRALSPAVNDPTTAVQVLDHLGETLRMIGTAPPQAAAWSATTMTTGVIMPVRTWPDILMLAVTEIREFGAESIQVVRRLHAMLDELRTLVLPENRPAVDQELRRLHATITAHFGDGVDIDLARERDGQGIGGPVGAREADTMQHRADA
ncbi:MAG TPA: DUF2254 domain-containing protein [Candidatus Limnocylindrales bacterium]|nr:DUF2254 domain-containing protein [Candidatus Limnocylindrales bacterium]